MQNVCDELEQICFIYSLKNSYTICVSGTPYISMQVPNGDNLSEQKPNEEFHTLNVQKINKKTCTG